MKTTLLGLLTVMAVSNPLGAQSRATRSTSSAEIPFAQIAQDYLASMGKTELRSRELSALLEEKFAHLDLGLFRLYFPLSSLSETSFPDAMRKTVLCLLAVQEGFLRDLDLGSQLAHHDKGLKALRSFMKGSDFKSFSKMAATTHRDLLAELELKPESQEALAALRKIDFKALGYSKKMPSSISLLIAPTRKDYVQFQALAGCVYPEHQSIYWTESTAKTVTLSLPNDSVIAVALEYALPESGADSWSKGMDMNKNTKTGAEQNLAQIAFAALFKRLFPAQTDPAIISGISANGVIDLYGENNSRVDGDTGSRQSNAISMFVAGGNATGGSLAGTVAENRWRADHGKDRFVKVLQRTQKDSGEITQFLLRDPDSKRFSVTGPFLVAGGAAGTLPSPSFAAEYAEFLRAYRICFFYWLQNQFLAQTSDSHALFGKLVREMSNVVSGDSFVKAAAKVYPDYSLSDAQLSERSLEGKFLRWLAKAN